MRESAAHIARTLQAHGYTAYFAGGCVRDLLLGREPKDYDIATDAAPETVQSLFTHTEAVGRAFGVILVKQEPFCFEVATFRTDISYSDGRRPDAVQFCGPEEDARRRDFGVNALFYDPSTEQVIDYVNGREDLKNKTIRAVGNPSERFAEDHLRMLRAARFASVLDFTVEEQTANAIRNHAGLLDRISVERVQAEIARIFEEAPKPGAALQLLRNLELLKHIFPELPSLNTEVVLNETADRLNRMRIRTASMGYAVVFFSAADADTAEKAMKRLRCSTEIVNIVCDAVRVQPDMQNFSAKPESEKRLMLSARGFPIQMELFRLSHPQDAQAFQALNLYAAEYTDRPLPAHWVRGGDLLKHGVSRGPAMKILLDKAYRAQLDGCFADKEELLNWLLTSDGGRCGVGTTEKD